MSLIRIDDELHRDVHGVQSVPHFKGLGRRAFPVAVPHDDQHRSLCILDVVDRGTFCVDRWVVINTGAEVGNHPLVNGILPVIAFPVGDTCASNGRPEAMCLGDSKHCHKSAIAPTGNANTIGVNGEFLRHNIDSGKQVTQISVAKILAIGGRKGFPLAIAAPRIWHQHEIVQR